MFSLESVLQVTHCWPSKSLLRHKEKDVKSAWESRHPGRAHSGGVKCRMTPIHMKLCEGGLFFKHPHQEQEQAPVGFNQLAK